MGARSDLEQRIREVQSAHHAGLAVPDFPRVEKVVKVIMQRPPGKMLDVGYSQGSFADYLLDQGWDCVGLDIEEHPASKVRVTRCDLNCGFPLDSESFDAVTAGEVIEHMIDEDMFVEECHRVLKKGGLLALTTPNLAFFLNRFLVLLGKLPMFVYAPYHYHFHTKKTITGLVERHGFQIERVLSSHVLYSRRKHATGKLFEWLGDFLPTFGAHLIVVARKL